MEDNTIERMKHTGAVHVRGMMIRRWRPRYLELDHDGVLRYYEATEENNMMSSLSQQESIKNNNNDGTHSGHNAHSNQSSSSVKSNSSKNNNYGSDNGENVLVGGETNKEYVHITNYDIMNREMQAFSLPMQLESQHSLNHHHRPHKQQQQQQHQSINNDNKKKEFSSSSDFTYESDTDYVVNDDDDDDEDVDTTTNIKVCSTKQNDNNENNQEAIKVDDDNVITTSCISNPASFNARSDLLNLHHHVHKHRAKAVMTILSARIIDVNSLRDIHVGLPKGSYGFVFCGRQLFSNTSDQNLLDNNDPTNNTADQHFDIRDDICHPLSILSSDHDYFDTSRDYLCSVNTLEEARKWVSVLRWAANISSSRSARQRLQHTTVTGGPCSDMSQLNYDQLSDVLSIDRTLSVESLRSGLSPTRGATTAAMNNNNYLHGLRRNSNLLEDLLIEDEHSISEHGTTAMASPSSCKSMEGITIVTKVKKIGLKLGKWQRLFGFKFEVMYEVRMLLLRNIHLSNRSKKRRKELDISGDSANWAVEERTIYRRYDEFIQLLDKLLKEFKSPKGNVDIVPTLKKARAELSNHPNLMVTKSSFISFHSNIKSSVESVDKVLRMLSTNGSLCNTSTVKEFLLKEGSDTSERDEKKKLSYIQSTLSSIIDDRCHNRSSILNIMIGDSTDEFVKGWLFGNCNNSKQGGYEKKFMLSILLLQNPVIEAFVTIIYILFLLQGFTVWSRYLRNSLTFRIDLLLFHSIGVFCCGFRARSMMNDKTTETSRNDCLDYMHLRKRNDIKTKTQIQKPEKPKKHRKKLTPTNKKLVRVDLEDSIEHTEEVFASLSDEPRALSSPLPMFSSNHPSSSWSKAPDNIFKVRGKSYLTDRIKIPSAPAPFTCRGVDMFLTDNPERHIARHPSVLGGQLSLEDTFLVNFLLPFGNFVIYFSIPPLCSMPKNVASVWTKFINGNQQDRDDRLKLLPLVVDGPWIVKKAVGHGPALLGQAIPLQYYFTQPTDKKKGVYEVDVIITASRIAKGILNVVKSHTKRLTIAFAFIIEAAKESELPETVLASCQLHSLHLELCPQLPKYFLEDESDDSYDS